MTIEHGIEIPERGAITAVAAQMGHGDSITVPTKTRATNFGVILRRRGRLSVTRKLPDGTYRVWALDKEQS